MGYEKAYQELCDALSTEFQALTAQHKAERKALLERQLAKRTAFVRDNAAAALEAKLKRDEAEFRQNWARDLE